MAADVREEWAGPRAGEEREKEEEEGEWRRRASRPTTLVLTLRLQIPNPSLSPVIYTHYLLHTWPATHTVCYILSRLLHTPTTSYTYTVGEGGTRERERRETSANATDYLVAHLATWCDV